MDNTYSMNFDYVGFMLKEKMELAVTNPNAQFKPGPYVSFAPVPPPVPPPRQRSLLQEFDPGQYAKLELERVIKQAVEGAVLNNQTGAWLVALMKQKADELGLENVHVKQESSYFGSPVITFTAFIPARMEAIASTFTLKLS